MKERLLQAEWMDDFEVGGEELDATLNDISKINRWLGGDQWTSKALFKMWRGEDKNTVIRLCDVGCGNGDFLALMAKKCAKKGIPYEFVGIDANPNTIEIARAKHADVPNVSFSCQDVFQSDIAWHKMDYVCSNLTLHHFENQQLSELIHLWCQRLNKGFVVNDLHRSRMAIPLFKWVARVFKLHPLSVADGLTSIQKGFKKQELAAFMQQSNISSYSLQWKWAFRLLLTYKKTS